VIEKLGNTTSINYVNEKVNDALSFRVKSNEYFIPFDEEIDVEAEKEKLEEELKYTQGFLNAVQKKLSNERFVNNAPAQVITNERKKEADALAKIETLKVSLKSLK
ncbi:MAG: valine--tRNA ligase, partial [Draconibacterium sp.]|nr:valine--tRNA ligase [Draconibacterium sp.]